MEKGRKWEWTTKQSFSYNTSEWSIIWKECRKPYVFSTMSVCECSSKSGCNFTLPFSVQVKHAIQIKTNIGNKGPALPGISILSEVPAVFAVATGVQRNAWQCVTSNHCHSADAATLYSWPSVPQKKYTRFPSPQSSLPVNLPIQRFPSPCESLFLHLSIWPWL